MALFMIGPLDNQGSGTQIVFQAAKSRTVPITQYMLVNRDDTNPIYFGSDQGGSDNQQPDLTGGDTRATNVLNALETTVVSSEFNWWAASPSAAVVLLQVTETAKGWTASPAEVAVQVSAAGIPPTDNPKPLNNSPVFNQTIAAGATYTSPRMTVKQYQSWFGKMFCTATSAGVGTNPFTQFEMNWSVASDGFDPLRTEDWFVPNTPFNFTYNYINQGQGFVIGDTLTLSVTNLDTMPVNLTYGLFGSYRTRSRSSWRGKYFDIVSPGFGIGTDDILSELNFNAAANSATTPQLMNLWEGPVTIAGASTPNPANVTVRIQPQGAAGALPPYYEIPVPTGAAFTPATVILPRRVCTIYVVNGSAGTVAGAFLVTGQVQPE